MIVVMNPESTQPTENEPQNEIAEITDYMARKHETLGNNYRDESGEFVDSCGLIADELATVFLRHSQEPQILRIRGHSIDRINTASIKPRIYEGRVDWGGHSVCANNGKVYDPMLASPEDIDTYMLTTFDQPVDYSVAAEAASLRSRLLGET